MISYASARALDQPIVSEDELLKRITVNPEIFGGKPIIRGRRMAVEHVLGMLAAGDSVNDLLDGFKWLEREDVEACLVFARSSSAPKSLMKLAGGLRNSVLFSGDPVDIQRKLRSEWEGR